MDTIAIHDLGVLCHIGVPEQERAKPQRLQITIEMHGDFSKACLSDEIEDTINYYAVSRSVAELCQKRSFKLIEALAQQIADMIRSDFHAEQVTVEVKKFILSDARHVSFRLSR